MKVNKILISAKCQPSSKRIIRNSKYTYGDALDFFAKVLTNRSASIQSLIKVTESEIVELNLYSAKIEYEINEKEKYLNKLLKELKSRDNNYNSIDNDLKSSLESIKQIAVNFNCSPLEIDKFTGYNTLSFHARKCNIPLYELEQHLKT